MPVEFSQRIGARWIERADAVTEALRREAAEVKVRSRFAGLSRSSQHRETMFIADCLVFTSRSRQTCPYSNNLSHDLPFERESVEVKIARLSNDSYLVGNRSPGPGISTLWGRAKYSRGEL